MENNNNNMQEQEKPIFRHMQAKLTEEEYKEVSIWLLQNDITEKQDWIKMIMLREVRGYEPVRTNKRLHSSEDVDGFDVHR